MDQQTFVTLLMGLAVSAFIWFGFRRRVSKRSFGPSPSHPSDSSLDVHFALAALYEPNHAGSSPSHHAPMLETSPSVDHSHSGFDGGAGGYDGGGDHGGH